MKSTDIHRSEWMPLYEAIPFKSKILVFERMGYNHSSKLLSKAYISEEQYNILKQMNDNLVLFSLNTVGKAADYDHTQMLKYSKGLIALISSDIFKTYKQHNKTKIVDEQMRIQKIINKNN